MTNPSETRDSELVRRWQDIRARMEAVPEDTPYIDVFADAVEWAADAIQAADTIDRLTSTGEAVAWLIDYSDGERDIASDREAADLTAKAFEEMTGGKATVRPLYVSPREVPGEPGVREAFTALDLADSLIERAYGLDVPREWNMAYRKVAKARAALPHNQGETKLSVEPWECDGFVADASGSSRCHNCGKRRGEHRRFDLGATP